MKNKKVSTRVKKALSDGNIRKANALLGEIYAVEGLVVRGRQVGRILGFPTANLKLSDPSSLFLANGVYAVTVRYRQEEYNGMANIGLRPTFDQHEITLEVNLFGFSGDLYGQELRVYFFDRIREERKFAGPEELKAQILADQQRTEELLAGRNHPDPGSK